MAVAELRQKMAADHLLIWLQQFAHQFYGVNAQKGRSI
jgi:hypothetical protein